MKYLFSLAILFSVPAFSLPTLELLSDPKLLKTADTNRLSLIFYPAPTSIDWTSPGAMVRSVTWNTLTGDPNPLAHIDVMVKCTEQEPVITGMSRVRTYGQIGSVLLGKKGLELMTDFYPGFLVSENDILAAMPDFIAAGKVRVLSMDLSKSNCARLISYLNDYKKRGYDKTYSGFTANPFKGEGAGCAAFGISTLKVTGLLENEFAARWVRQVRVPKRLMNSAAQVAQANFWNYVFLRTNEAWAKSDEAATDLTVYDPQLMFDWLGRIYENPAAWDSQAKRFSKGAALEIGVDRSRAPTPKDDYWIYEWPPIAPRNRDNSRPYTIERSDR